MLFSIITVSLNAQNLIADTINSVLSQDFDDYEIIVKDGCSTDNTIKMIPYDERIRIIIEKDTGIYNAMNQAIKKAKGEYLLFLNCGDKLYSNDVLSTVASAIKEQNLKDSIVYGNRYTEELGIITYPKKIKKNHFYYSTICHQAAFIARSVFEVVGFYDETNKIVSDREFFLDCAIKKVNYVYLDKTLCEFRSGGVSETEKGLQIAKKEMKKVKKTRFNFFERCFLRFAKTWLGQMLVKIKHKIKKWYARNYMSSIDILRKFYIKIKTNKNKTRD